MARTCWSRNWPRRSTSHCRRCRATSRSWSGPVSSGRSAPAGSADAGSMPGRSSRPRCGSTAIANTGSRSSRRSPRGSITFHQRKRRAPMPYREVTEKLAAYRREIAALRDKMRALQQQVEPEEVENYRFATSDGPVRLSELFGDKEYLFVIHNMGEGCPACTMWADGFNGVLPHLENRAAFVVSSPDDPPAQRAFAAERGWRFRMVSHQGTSFAADMGYRNEQGWLPGVSVFRRLDDRIYRVSDAPFDAGDDFCAVYHLFDLLPEGAAGWRPQFSYS